MNKLAIYILSFSVILNGCSAPAKKEVPLNEKKCASSNNGLKIRELPNQGSKQLGLLKYGESISINKYSDNSETISNITAKWANIHYGKIEGWVFAGFLKDNCPKLIEDGDEYLGLKKYKDFGQPIFTFVSKKDSKLILGSMYKNYDCKDENIQDCFQSCSYEAGGKSCNLLSFEVTKTKIIAEISHSDSYAERNSGYYICEIENSTEIYSSTVLCKKK